MKALFRIVGVCALLAGLLFAGQGAGYIDWPVQSFMIRHKEWIYYGLITAVVGLVLILAAPSKAPRTTLRNDDLDRRPRR